MDEKVLAAWKSALEGDTIAGNKYYAGSMGLKEWVETETPGEADENPAGYWVYDPFGLLCELYALEHEGCKWELDKDLNCYSFIVTNSTDTRVTALYAPDEVLAWAGLNRELWEDDIIAQADWKGKSFPEISEWLDLIW